MLNKIILTVAILFAAQCALADAIAINPDHPDKYVVVKGDTLWDISARFLTEPWRWPEIWRDNPQIENPHLIYPGDVISLTYENGQPMLTVQRGGSGQRVSGRNVKLSPEVRVYDKEEAIPSIPIDAIQQFLKRPRILSKDEMDTWPYVVSSYDQHLIATTGNKIYVRGLPEDSEDQRFSIYRKGEAYRNPRKDKDEILGYEAIYVGDAVLEKEGDPASAIVTVVDREIIAGDRLAVQSDDELNTAFIPSPPYREVEGNILSVYDGISQIGTHQIVVFDIGEEDGIETGNVLGVYQSGVVVKDKTAAIIKQKKEDEKLEKLRQEDKYSENESALGGALEDLFDGLLYAKRTFDRKFPYFSNRQAKAEEVTLPEEKAGVVMVFKTFDKLSYGIIMETTGPIHVLDTVKNL